MYDVFGTIQTGQTVDLTHESVILQYKWGHRETLKLMLSVSLYLMHAALQMC